MLGKIEDRRKGITEDKTVGWSQRSTGREFEQARGVGEGQGSPVFCSPQGHQVLDTTERLSDSNKVQKD